MYLVRVAGKNEFRRVQPVHTKVERPLPSADTVRKGHALRKVGNAVETDFFMLMTTIFEGKDRPFYPYCLLMVESESGAIVGQEMMTVDTSLNAMLGQVPVTLMDELQRLAVRPARLTIRPGRLDTLLRPLCEALGIELHVQRKLPQLDRAKESLIEFFLRNRR